MDKTPFAGLTRLDPGEPLSTDGSSFTAINPTIIDRLLALGARLHRHDAHPALVAPSEPPVVIEGASGGFIPASVTALVTYTLIDADGGETLPAPSIALTTPDGVVAPEGIPEYTVESVAGDMLSGTFYYGLTLTDGTGGETTIGPVITVDIPAGSGSNQVRFVGLSDIVAGYPGAQGWRLYKGSQYNRMHFLASGNAALDEVLDDGNLCADCATTPPDDNTTAATNSIDITIPAHPVNQATRVVAYRIYVGVGGDLTSPALLGQYDIATLGTVRNVLDLQMDTGAPPDYATAIGGATKIDPNTDILDFHWLPPVETHADLPEGARGDVRMTLDNGRIWVVLASEAFGPEQWAQAAGGGGSGGGHEIWDEGVLKGPQGILDFVGPGVTVTEDPGIGKLVVTIPGGGGGGGGAPTYAGGTFAAPVGDQAIPDNNTYLESILLPVADTAIIGTDTDYPKLFLWIQHAYISDLVIELVAPDGTTVQVLPGDYGEANLSTGIAPGQRAYFHPYAAQSYTALQSDNAVGEWMPSGDWNTLVGKDITGSWQLKVRDIYSGDAGIVKGWGLEFTAGATAQPHSVPLLTSQALEWREGHHNGPLKARMFLRPGVTELNNWSLVPSQWPHPNEFVDESNAASLTLVGNSLIPTDLTVKRFTYGGYWQDPLDLWWLDDFVFTFRFEILAGHAADWGSVQFGIKDASGNKVGMRVSDDYSGIKVFEEYGGVETFPDLNPGSMLIPGVYYLTVERVGHRFYFSLWNTDPNVAANTPVQSAAWSTGASHMDVWSRGLSNQFRPYWALAPDATNAVTYFEVGSRIAASRRALPTVHEVWAWGIGLNNVKVVRPVIANDREVMESLPGDFGRPVFHPTVVTNNMKMVRDGQFIKWYGTAQLGGAADYTVSAAGGIPKKLWPDDDTYVFVPYLNVEATGQNGEIWQISEVGVITRYGPAATANKQVALAGISYLASGFHI